jgi:hypothetical protein
MSPIICRSETMRLDTQSSLEANAIVNLVELMILECENVFKVFTHSLLHFSFSLSLFVNKFETRKRLSEWVNEWMNEWMNECERKVCVCVCVCLLNVDICINVSFSHQMILCFVLFCSINNRIFQRNFFKMKKTRPTTRQSPPLAIIQIE